MILNKKNIQKINPNIEIPVSITIEDNNPNLTLNISNMDGWNMIGLPLDVEDSNYQSIFPDAINGTLYSFNDGYLQEENLEPGNGYWLRFNEAGVTSISGLEIESITLEITEGWNVISGISSFVQISEIEDPDELIIPGTVYGFSLSGYVNAYMLEPGYGYWLRSSGNGNIVVSNYGTASNKIITNNFNIFTEF